jgi:hypothetical protein
VVVLKIAAFSAGIALVAWALRSAVETVILPRSAQNTLARLVFRTTGGLFRFLANERRDYVTRDRIMALYAPVSLLLLPAVWVATILIGFLAMFWALGRTVGEAFLVSGSSLLTLGFAPVDTVVEQILAFSEATLGLGIVALLITFLPSLYSAFSRRETQVALLETRAGSPPSAIEFLVRFHRLEWLDQMERFWERWETWFADVQESHTSYAALNFFRSPQSDQSWIVAAGTVLDAASLTLAAVDVPQQPQAAISIRAGYVSLRRIADFFGISYDPDPQPDDPISIRREEFDEVCDRLTEAGVPLYDDRDQAWRGFAGWRVNYDTVLLALADLIMAPYAPWTSDRSAPDHVRPRIRLWGLATRRRSGY